MKQMKDFPYYCLLFAAHPSLALITKNISEDDLSVVIRPLLVSILLAVVLLFINRFFYKNPQKTGLITILELVIFFSFGHILQVLEGVKVLGLAIGRIRFLGPLALVLIVLGIWGIKRVIKVPSFVPGYLLIVSLLLLVFQVYPIAKYYIDRGIESGANKITSVYENSAGAQSSDKNTLPDIYYIILDSYTRSDVLADVYQFDNQPFLNQLRGMGFYVAECSRSNYQVTLLSLASSMNMDYLPELDDRIQLDAPMEKAWLEELIKHSKIRYELNTAGYRLVAFDTRYKGTSISDADELIAIDKTYQQLYTGVMINPFEEVFIKTTAAIAFYRLPLGSISEWVQKYTFPYYIRAESQLFKLNVLPDIAGRPGPMFVFVHLMIPHYPFMFKPNGELQSDLGYYTTNILPVDNEYQVNGYKDQIQFINNRLPDILSNIISKSNPKPIIIIQGDHGLDLQNRSEILNAYYFPNNIGYNDLYPAISPANSFRVVLNNFFGKSYPYLPDQIYQTEGITVYTQKKVEERNLICLENGNQVSRP